MKEINLENAFNDYFTNQNEKAQDIKYDIILFAKQLCEQTIDLCTENVKLLEITYGEYENGRRDIITDHVSVAAGDTKDQEIFIHKQSILDVKTLIK